MENDELCDMPGVQIEIRFARNWFKLFFAVWLIVLACLIFCGIMYWNEVGMPPFFMFVIPIIILLVMYWRRMNNTKPQLIFSENGIHISETDSQANDSSKQTEEKRFVPWAIIQEAEFISSRGKSVVAIITKESGKYSFNVGNLEMLPERIVSSINNLVSSDETERKELLLKLSTNQI